MTTALVIMVGAGILLVISAIENSSILLTFQAIWGGKPISSIQNSASVAAANSANTPSTTPPASKLPGAGIPK